MAKQSKWRRQEPWDKASVVKGKVTLIQVAIIIERYLTGNNYTNILSAFQGEAGNLLSKIKGKENVRKGWAAHCPSQKGTQVVRGGRECKRSPSLSLSSGFLVWWILLTHSEGLCHRILFPGYWSFMVGSCCSPHEMILPVMCILFQNSI